MHYTPDFFHEENSDENLWGVEGRGSVQGLAIDQNLTFLADAIGGCERIFKTPIPLSYTRYFPHNPLECTVLTITLKVPSSAFLMRFLPHNSTLGTVLTFPHKVASSHSHIKYRPQNPAQGTVFTNPRKAPPFCSLTRYRPQSPTQGTVLTNPRKVPPFHFLPQTVACSGGRP